ncbi:MAG: inorganic phosphate transporter [Paludibacteraceae bacterium]|nr:inorganic phosphate transporter [Paludibacteraceae bacterium]
MNTLFLGIVVFLIVLAIFDLVVGVSNDAVNFLNSAIGAKVAKYKTIVLIASIGVFAGAAMSNGMMDVARHGIMTPTYFSFYDVICVFLAVMVTDVILLDIYNTIGMPTSTTVSMVFELLGGAFAIALIKIANEVTDINGVTLSLGDLLNTEKAFSVILGIFLSVAIAFVFGTIVQWIARMVFTFTYRVNGTTTDANGEMDGLTSSSIKIGVFGGIAVTSIIWFLLLNGLKSSSIMTPELKAALNENAVLILGAGFALFSVVMTILSALKLPVLKVIVLLGTFALAMAFAGNDLVNFVGVPLTGLDAYTDYITNGKGDASTYMMTSLMETAHTPTVFLMMAGVIMVLSLVFSKKAQNVVKTSVDLSRQDEGDEMFGSSKAARLLVRNAQRVAVTVDSLIPTSAKKWIDSRFNSDGAVLPNGAAFDQIRAAVNLVLAGLLVAFGTSMKLPLSTTYVTFMVAMGTSLADRAWSRESAVFRITGVLSVIGGWFITAGAAFTVCFLITNLMHFGSFIAMVSAIVLSIIILIRNNKEKKENEENSKVNELFKQIIHSYDNEKCWSLIREHVSVTTENYLKEVTKLYEQLTSSFFNEEYRILKRATIQLDDLRKDVKRQRRKQIIALRRIDPLLRVEKGTWYFLINSSLSEMIYSLKRMGEPCREHIGNNFRPVPIEYVTEFLTYRNEIIRILDNFYAADTRSQIRDEAAKLQFILSRYRTKIINDIQTKHCNIESMTIFLNIVQESQQLLSALRHTTRGKSKFEE